MNKEKAFLLQVLSDHLLKRRTVIETISNYDLNWENVILLSRIHQVEGILFYQCKNFLPENIKGRLAQLYASDLFFYSNRVKQYRAIAKRLNEEEIPFYTVKGMAVSQYYPVPALRTMGDCDIVVHSENKTKAHVVMLSLGFDMKSQTIKEWTYCKNGVEFEIHDHLLYDDAANSNISLDYMESAWEYAKPDANNLGYELDWNFHFIFLLLHLKKHFLKSGVGFRQFMDLVVVIQNKELNWTWLRDVLQKLEMLEFATVCCTFCERWFGVEMPLAAELDEVFFKESTEKIFENGVFGFDDPNNKDNAVLNQVDKIGKKKTLIRNAFPSYDYMRFVPYYSFLNNRPWLLPFAWLYRFIRIICNGKGTDGMKLIKATVSSDEKIFARKQILQKWGL